MEGPEKRISKLEDKIIDFNQYEQQRKHRQKKQ